jgi:hypothetical protein
MAEQPSHDNTRLDRIERSLEALASTAADFFSQMAAQNARMAEIQAQQATIQTQHTSRLNDHEETLLDHEEEHRRLLRAQVLIADELREIAAANREGQERLNALIAVVDDLIRRNPKQ